MKKKVYISGKITGLPIQQVTMKFGAAQKEIELMGYEAVNPIVVVDDSNTTWEIAMKKCISALVGCDALLLLSDWESSKGAIIERQLADDLGILIVNNTKFGKEVLKRQLDKHP